MEPGEIDFSSSDSVRMYLEQQVLLIIKTLADEGQTPLEKLQDMAKLTLEKFSPSMDVNELYQNAIGLKDVYPEFLPVALITMREYERSKSQLVQNQASVLIKQGKYAEATTLLEDAAIFKM